MRYSNYSVADRKTIEQMVSVKEWNKDKSLSEQIPVKYGYVMPLFHGYDWKATKQRLINKYCFSPLN